MAVSDCASVSTVPSCYSSQIDKPQGKIRPLLARVRFLTCNANMRLDGSPPVLIATSEGPKTTHSGRCKPLSCILTCLMRETRLADFSIPSPVIFDHQSVGSCVFAQRFVSRSFNVYKSQSGAILIALQFCNDLHEHTHSPNRPNPVRVATCVSSWCFYGLVRVFRTANHTGQNAIGSSARVRAMVASAACGDDQKHTADCSQRRADGMGNNVEALAYNHNAPPMISTGLPD
jgi:hypothetical protein